VLWNSTLNLLVFEALTGLDNDVMYDVSSITPESQ
jgi:hypothetical protein